MKTKIFMALLLCPIVLPAQNGVTVSNLNIVGAGTVTFNVSWKTPMPVALWSDSVWVFVDYNNAGRMERLPVTGATVSAGTVIKIPGNDKGVWVVGNARSAGNFSATVQLFTTTSNLAGACAYASNYPPVGEYISNTEISFIGTPMYEISLAHSSRESTVVKSGDMFLLPCDYAFTSFTDATGAPGIMGCTPPGATVNFTAFTPCNNATTGDYWYLTDTRESNNIQTYKVMKLHDGHIWMVQDLKFGNKCTKTSFNGSTKADLTGNVTTLTDQVYYGDCMNAKLSTTPAERGYLYDWAAAINQQGAYEGSRNVAPCTGTSTATSACQGICPVGWHVPTGDPSGEMIALWKATGCNSYNACFWREKEWWNGSVDFYNASEKKMGTYWVTNWTSSAHLDVPCCAYTILVYDWIASETTRYGRANAVPVRCVMNY
jgi:uncharacterized protein (TIGR02145 family)